MCVQKKREEGGGIMVVDTMRAIREEMRQIAVLGVPISATRMIVALTRITVRLFVWSSIDQHELSMYEYDGCDVHGTCRNDA